ncbi:MAG: hypothetical protein AB7I08_08545 [Thermoleophilia bacterium]
MIALLTLVLVAITGFYAWQNWRMAEEMRASRRQAMMPRFVLDLDVVGPHAVFLSVQNAGLGAALSGRYELRLLLVPSPDGEPRERVVAWSAVLFPPNHDRPFNFAEDREPWGADEIVERIRSVELTGLAYTTDGERVEIRADIEDMAAHMDARRAVTTLNRKSDTRYIRDELLKMNRTLSSILSAMRHDR